MNLKKLIFFISVMLSVFFSGCSYSSKTESATENTSVSKSTSVTSKSIPSNMSIPNNSPSENSVKFISVKAGNKYTIALRNDGTVWAWGDNANGQLGDGTTESKNIPIQVKGLSDIIAITSGWSHVVALKKDGSVWSWGNNGMGQLGDGSKGINKNSPVQVKVLNEIAAIDASGYNSIALKKDGTIWAWGDNTTGQLGSSRTNGEIPEQVQKISGVKSISSGGSFTLALKNDGEVWAWGYDKNINLYVDGYADSPRIVQGINDITEISGSPGGIIALKKDGKVWTWGSVPAPEQIIDLIDIVSIDKGQSHNIVVKKDGTVWTWGNNKKGQLGNGKAENKSFLISQIKDIADIFTVSAGGEHSVAIKKDGTIWTWGSNEKGQLGDGTNEDKLTPIKVLFK